MNEMNDEMLDRIVFSTAEIRDMTSGKRNDKCFLMHSLEESKIHMKKCFKNLIASKIFVFFVFTLIHLFIQNTSNSDERNIYTKLQMSFKCSRKLEEQGKASHTKKGAANTVKKKKVSATSLKKEKRILNTEGTRGSGHAKGVSANMKVASSGAAKNGARVKAGISDTGKNSSDTVRTSRDAVTTRGDAAKTSGDTPTAISDTASPTSDATTSSNDATESSSDATTINGEATGISSAATTSVDSTAGNGDFAMSSGEATTSGGKAEVMHSCLKTGTTTKREKRKVWFADPISCEKLFYEDQCIGYTGENEKKEKVEEEEEEEEEKKKKKKRSETRKATL
ncbi:hypothetical protein C922_02875 [Plasmodium inui San Antonio 1]|uniref:Uncharacterized protein n=1 Tax=Plasmodium inui San Antonio 1 TaxID=1237626 RepID=W7ACP9_9APIC|nr:hypothetical protein C922_02875 [Plasmodium inui San Antonio 1]EUD66889.1 hypothetical protein C922_02875 [Plasmodium inui San Antonio 1]